MFFLCRAALPALRESHGNIVNIASDSGVRGEAYLVAYCASKAAVYYLAGTEAGFIAGTNLSIDGGTTSGTYAELQ
jgi:short-subunit dehydrogenase